MFTSVNHFPDVWHVARHSAHGSRTLQTSDLYGSFARARSVRFMRFLVYFLRFRCVNVTTLFNIDVKIRFRTVATASCSAAILRHCCGHVCCSTRVPGISVYIFRVHCGISACKQSALCCYDGFCTNLCCANVDVLHHNSPAYR